MLAWRIAKKCYAKDRSGAGGLAAGGRWHQAGQPVLYAGLSVEISVLEKLVHTGSHVPADLVLIEITLPDESVLYERPNISALPSGWYVTPPNDGSAIYGTAFLRAGRALGLIVPSAIVPEASNIVINPTHPRFSEVQMKTVRTFEFDGRLVILC